MRGIFTRAGARPAWYLPVLIGLPVLLSGIGCGHGADFTTGPIPVGSISLEGLPLPVDTVHSQRRSIDAVIRDPSGAPMPGYFVHVTVLGATVQHPGVVGVSWFASQSDTAGAAFSWYTDIDGRLGIYLYMGRHAGHDRVVVSAGMVSDTFDVTLLPGNAAHLVLSPHDSTLCQGGVETLRAKVTDSYGNVRNDSVAVDTTSSGLSHGGETLTAERPFGREFASARAGTLVDTAWISVVPRGTIAAWYHAANGVSGPAVFNLDGSGLRFVVLNSDDAPGWMPSGDTIASIRPGLPQTLALTTLGAGSPVQYPIDTLVRQNLSRPTSSADGRFIYLTGQSGGLYRLSRDDGRVTALPNIPPLDEFPSFPSPSPDGHRLAFQFTYQQDQHIGLYDLDSLRVTDLGLLGESPRFSPDGSEIAFLTSHVQGWGLVIANSDGTGSRVVAVDMGEVLFPSWSPDGQWILLGSTVVNVASGLKLPLSYFSDGYNTYTTNAVWHP